jgi:hypothetical protein
MDLNNKKHIEFELIINKKTLDYSPREQELIKNIDSLFQYIIVRTEKNLSKNFINNYILNPKYNSCSKDEDITLEILYTYQPQYFKP